MSSTAEQCARVLRDIESYGWTSQARFNDPTCDGHNIADAPFEDGFKTYPQDSQAAGATVTALPVRRASTKTWPFCLRFYVCDACGHRGERDYSGDPCPGCGALGFCLAHFQHPENADAHRPEWETDARMIHFRGGLKRTTGGRVAA